MRSANPIYSSPPRGRHLGIPLRSRHSTVAVVVRTLILTVLLVGWIHAIACPSEDEIWVGELINWRVQKLVTKKGE